MNIALCSSTSDIKFSFSENLRGENIGSHGSVNDLNKKGSVQISNYDVKNVTISSHLVRQHLEGYSAGKKRLEEPVPKLEFIRTLLIDNYDSYTYNIYQELSVINGLPPVVIRNDELTWEDICHYLYEEKAFDNIVISPGPGSPSCPEDIGICLRLLSECGDIPILGVCLGHQALGYVHGAQVIHAPEPVHGRLSDLEHNGCRLFNDIPSGRNSEFKVVRYHSLVVDPESLPKELIPIAWAYSSETLPFQVAERSNSFGDTYARKNGQQVVNGSLLKNVTNGKSWGVGDSKEIHNRKVLMGIRHSNRPHYGLQFHPESVATRHGRQIFKNFGEITKDYWCRLRSSSTCGRTDAYAACMQVPNMSQMFQDASKYERLYRLAERKHIDMCNTLKPSHSNNVKFLKLNWKKIECLASQVGGAGNIFRHVFGDHEAQNTFWLDSASTEKRRARFSFMGGKGGSLWKQVTFRLENQSGPICKPGGCLTIEDAQGCKKTFTNYGFFEFLDKELQSFCYDAKDYEGLPFEFYGGYVGYIGYDLKVECGMASNRHKSRTPDACFFFADNLLVIDHDTNDIYVVSIQDDKTSNTSWFDDVEQKIINLKNGSPYSSLSQPCPYSVNSRCQSGFLSEKSKEQYIDDIKRCQKFIKDGESYELCLTTQMKKEVGDIDAFQMYLYLREKNPAPYAAWLNFSEENLCICCSSPERFLRLDRNGILEAKPIKGTIARGATPEEDESLRLQLQFSEKDQAENLMIVDLLRNDLGRVCEPGSVHVPHLMEVESYAAVHTMVSTIRGKKQSNMSAIDCVRAAFPGGSMTGAPKLRSMELLDTLETSSRGVYSGCIGFFSYNQTFDLNIVIRTIVIHDGEASIGAGGAITALSNSDDEYEEMILKTRAPANAVLEHEQVTT